MCRRIVGIALLLMLLSGLFLGRMHTLGETSSSIPIGNQRTSIAAAEAFYREINHFLETGDDSRLQQALDPEFADHSAYGEGDGRDGLLRYLTSLRSNFPELRLQATNPAARDDIVAVDLSLTGAPPERIAGLGAVSMVPTTGHELLRIEGSQVAERWASQELPPLIEVLSQAEMRFQADWLVESRIETVAFAPGAVEENENHYGVILVVESGSLSIEVEAGDDVVPAQVLADDAGNAPLPGGQPVRLAPESVVSVPTKTSFRIWNSGQDAAKAFALMLRPVTPHYMYGVDSWRDENAGGITRTSQISLFQTSLEEREFEVALIRGVVAPGVDLPMHAIGAIEMMTVADGSVEVEVSGATVRHYRPAKLLAPLIDGRQKVAPGEGTLASGNATVGYRAVGSEPATVWLVTIVPVVLPV